jgi:hypothetical protein
MPIVNDVLTIYDVFKLLAMMQGAFVLGVAVAIAFYYFKRTATENRASWSLLAVCISYMLVLAGTIITISRQVYTFTDPCYYLVGTGYLLGDIALIVELKRVIDNHLTAKINRRYEQEWDKIRKEKNAGGSAE